MAKFRPMITALAASLLAVAQMAPAAAAEWPTKTVNVIIP